MEIKITKVNVDSLEEAFKVITNFINEVQADENAEEKKEVKNPTFDDVVDKLCAKKHCTKVELHDFITEVYNTYPMAALSIFLKELAILLDNKYEGFINNSDEIYIISTMDGKPHLANKKLIKNFRNFAAFRTMEDAQYAVEMFKEWINPMFKSAGKQEDKEC